VQFSGYLYINLKKCFYQMHDNNQRIENIPNPYGGWYDAMWKIKGGI